jgi:hypothetical protein
MAGMGAAPKPSAVRPGRGLAQPLMVLPQGGRRGKPPKWPLPGVSGEEIDLWEQLWKLPQAVAWEKIGSERVVARYCRLLAIAEMRESGAAAIKGVAGLLGEVRQLEDRLGLSPMAMLRLRWQISSDEVAEKRQERVTSGRTRVRAVETA